MQVRRGGCVAALSLVSGWYSVGTCASFQKGALGIQISCFPFIRGHERRGVWGCGVVCGAVWCGTVRVWCGRGAVCREEVHAACSVLLS